MLRRWRNRLLATAGILAVALPLSDLLLGFLPETGDCRITHVVDGDTADFWCVDEGLVRARFTGFDTPELYSPKCASEFGRALAAQSWLRWTLGTSDELRVILGGTDRYGRRLADAFSDDRRLAEVMISSGLARPYSGGRREGWCA